MAKRNVHEAPPLTPSTTSIRNSRSSPPDRRVSRTRLNRRGSEPILIGLDRLRPTQAAVGMRAVGAKREKIATRVGKARKIERFLEARPIPVVRGPGADLYLIDHHHLGLALWQTQVASAYVEIIEDFSDLSRLRFWRSMEAGGWLHPFNEMGQRISPAALPPALDALKHDPYRDLAWSVREEGGFRKTRAPYSEFAWASFFRPRVSPDLLKTDYAAAVRRAVRLAKHRDASGLPGFVVK